MSGQTAKIIQFPAHRREPEPLIGLRDLMALYGFSERWWRYRIHEGMPVVRWGGTLRFRATEVEAWMEARKSA